MLCITVLSKNEYWHHFFLFAADDRLAIAPQPALLIILLLPTFLEKLCVLEKKYIVPTVSHLTDIGRNIIQIQAHGDTLRCQHYFFARYRGEDALANFARLPSFFNKVALVIIAEKPLSLRRFDANLALKTGRASSKTPRPYTDSFLIVGYYYKRIGALNINQQTLGDLSLATIGYIL